MISSCPATRLTPEGATYYYTITANGHHHARNQPLLLPPMKSATKHLVVFVTAPDLKTARRLAKTALTARLIACANLAPGIESHYWWQGKLESGSEVLMILKTTRARLAALEKLILAHHPYDTPEILAMAPQSGTGKYLAWLAQSCGEN
jgi:periplasmic divalent cation tolerance protein